SATRAASPRLVPPGGSLPGELNGPGLPDDGHLDLTGIFELVLDPSGNILGQPHGLLVRHPIALHDDADLAAGLKRERFRDALERVGDPLELLQAFDVR